MSFSRSYLISLVVLSASLIGPFLSIVYKLRRIDELNINVLVIISLAFLFAAGMASVGVRKYFGNKSAGRFNIYLGVFCLIFFSYPLATRIVQLTGGWWDVYYLSGWLFGATTALLGTWFTFRYLNIDKVATITAAAIVIVAGLQWGLDADGEKKTNVILPPRAPEQGNLNTDRIVSDYADYRVSDPVNIYYLLPDTFPRTDFLLDMDIVDNRGFEQELENLGFVVPPKSTTNFHSTVYSVRSTFAMRVLNNPDLTPTAEHEGALLFDFVYNGWSATHELLRRSGYTIFNAAGRQRTGFTKCEGYCPPENIRPLVTRNKTLSEILKFTPLHSVAIRWFETYFKGFLGSIWRETFNISDADVDLMLRESPFFLFVHAFTPHPPFLYDAKCNYRSGKSFQFGERIELKVYKTELAEDIRCANHFIKSQVKRISAKDPNAVIIVQSDHGLRILNSNDVPENLQYVNWYGNFSALRLPKRCRNRVPENLSNVNTFPLVLSCLGNREISSGYPNTHSAGQNQ